MIFDDIWQADMRGNGLIPLIKGVSDNEEDPKKGYVIVDMNPYSENDFNRRGRDHHENNREVTVLQNVFIPEEKKHSYELFKKLHDNYDWRVKETDPTPAVELEETDEFLRFVIETEPMKIARKYAEEQGFVASESSNEEWILKLKSMWFEQYRDNSTSAFEHVFIGEQGKKPHVLDGHHFWYHYYINDGPYEVTHLDDVIHFLKYVEVNRTESSNKAEVITIRYTYVEKDDTGRETLLYKETGGFFVGVSTEGLLALGTVAFLDGRKSIPIVINGEEYELVAFKEGGHFRTFYPKIIDARPV